MRFNESKGSFLDMRGRQYVRTEFVLFTSETRYMQQVFLPYGTYQVWMKLNDHPGSCKANQCTDFA